MKLSSPMLSGVVYCGQKAGSKGAAQTPMHYCHCYLLLCVILPPPAEDMFDDIGQKSDDSGEVWHTNP